ncbi:uncharacterized protein LOC133203897 [Saccostrea echinata]|uniref:uncharacterized protein LOC133203897 n=1 Tax=Saccostrea echinata TaxID=191078 RepID=UPI002A7EE25C|nr:uncharacterized protein LOC133203897 [Saccostrea echinata]
MRRGMTDTTAEENIRESKKKIDTWKPFDSYFVETQLVNATKEALKKSGVAILTGPPGCGKTSTAYHLMLGEVYKDWTIRIIRTYDEFTFLESGKNTFVYIDNFLDGFLCFEKLDKWLDIFTTIFYKHIRKTENGLTTISGSGNVHLLITTRENVYDRICKYMKQGRSPVFNIKCIVDARLTRLSDEEKDGIFDSQIRYADEIMKIGKPAEDKEFRKRIKQAEGPVGFPLCAHLFACKEEYRYTGPHFFSYPLKYFRTQIKHEIDADKTKKTMTLLLLLFLFESKSEDASKSENLDLRNEKECEKLLHSLITPKKSSKFHPLDFENLTNVAENLTNGILTGLKESGFYRFKHQTIREAVGNFFCTEYYENAMELFPLEVLLSQNFSSCSIDQYIALTSRLISEIERGSVSMVFSCIAFKDDAYSTHFFKQLQPNNDKRLRRFLLIPDEKSSIPLQAIFWISKYNLKTLLELFLSLIGQRGIDVEIHKYLALFGEICTFDENLQSKADRNMCRNVAETKRAVFEYMDSEKNTILGIVIRSDRSDDEAMNTIKMLLKENKNIVKHINQHNETPVMLALNCNRERKKVLKEILHSDISLKLSSKDEKGWTVFHHCITSDLKDKECIEYLTILLNSKLQRDLNCSSELGETVLNLAAKHAKHSRILSILSLIEDKDINTMDNDGRTPIHNAVALLKEVGHDPYIELEIATRVSIFMIYGCDVGLRDDENFLAADICNKTHYDGIKRILALKSKNQKQMSEIIQQTLHQIEGKSSSKCVTVPNPMGLISSEMLNAIGCAAECLAEIEFKSL